MVIKKNGAVIAVISLLLCVAVYLNWSYSRSLNAGADEAMDFAMTGQTDAAAPADATAAAGETLSDSQRFTENQWVMMSQTDGKEQEAQSGVGQARVTQLSEYFDQTRLGRQQSKDEALGLLKQTIADAASSAEAKSRAEEAMAALAANTVKESRIESLVIAKGFLECVAMVDESGVSVVVLPVEAGLVGTDVAKIKDIILSETTISADKIRVMEAG